MGTYKGFTSVELRKPQRSSFDLSHEKRITTRMGKLTPIFISETLPNDTFSVNSEVMLRLAPLLAPIFHRVNVFVHFFFIPNRLLAEWWEPFITGGREGVGIDTAPTPSFITLPNILDLGEDYLDTGSLADYLGVPNIPDADTALWTGRSIDAMAFAAFQKCWEDYYRDRNYVDDSAILPLPEGANNDPLTLAYLLQTRTRAWEHDYFTSSLLTTQRGTEVLMPIQGSGAVTYLDQSEVYLAGGAAGTGAVAGDAGLMEVALAPGRIENIDEVTITNSNVSINDLRQAVRLQEWMERNQLAGSRYNESILAHFGRKTSDARLQRAEYLGGGKVAVKISEVVTTAFSEDAASEVVPAGNMAGHGLSFGNTNKFSYNCEEHGFVIGIMSVMPTSAYMQGLPRMFSQRNTFLDYPWPSFAHLGEQQVSKSEIYLDPTTYPAVRADQNLLGYNSRYSDWKYIPSSSHGDFRTSLDFWHITRKFSTPPTLSEAFVTFEDTLQDRIFAVSGVDTLWCYIYNSVHVKRSLPYFGTPTL